MRHGLLEIDLLLGDGIRMCRVADANPIDCQRWIALLTRIIHGRIHIPIDSVGIPEAKPVQVVLRHARHVELDHVAAIGHHDFRVTVAGCYYAIEGGGFEGERCDSVADKGLEERGDRSG